MPSSLPQSSYKSSPQLPVLTSLAEEVSPVPESEGEVEQDQLAFTIDSPSRPHLQLFKNVFNTGKPLAGYCQDDPLWLLLAAMASPCTNCVKAPHNCKVLPNSPRCTNCSAKKTYSLGKILQYRYFARRCNQDLAYSRRFLELHGTSMHHAMWGIPLETWRQYDTNLHQRTSSTAVLLELNMLDDQDAGAVDRQELQTYFTLQQEEAAIAARRKRNHFPSPVAGPSRKKTTGSEVPKRHPRRKHITVEASSEPAPRVRLVIPPGRSVVVPPTVVPRAAPSPMEVPSRDEPSQGPAGLVQLAAAAEAQSGVVRQLVSPLPAMSPIKGTGSDPAPSSPIPIALRISENSSLTTALRDTSHALDARQREVEQLWSSSYEVLQHEAEYCSVLDQFSALDRALLGLPGQTVVQRFQALEEELCDVALGKLSTASCKSSELKTALMQQQGLVDETNALAICQRHQQMIKEYPDEGFYEVVLPPLSQLEEDLQRANEDIRRIATFAHRLYRSDPATVLHHQSCYIGAIIEAVVAFLRRGLDSDDPDIVAHNFRLTLDYMQTARGIYGDLYMRSVSSIQWFFNNTVDEDEGLSSFGHASFTAPPDGSLEPPLHRQMLALSTAFPHRDGAGRWDNVVPIPSLDELTITMGAPAPMSVEPGVESSDVVVDQLLVESGPPSSLQVPLFLPEQESPTSPSPVLPPLFGSVAPLSIDLTGDNNELYEMEVRVPEVREVEIAAGEVMPKDEPL
ncbi:hypothetical protein EV359DRAFT_79180 [Lentinula novae-zelandiae]|nr:hypothetical protein EV359DRAFT_79180 [Lentinula novae-zelandiae]